MAYKWGLLFTNWDDPPSRTCVSLDVAFFFLNNPPGWDGFFRFSYQTGAIISCGIISSAVADVYYHHFIISFKSAEQRMPSFSFT